MLPVISSHIVRAAGLASRETGALTDCWKALSLLSAQADWIPRWANHESNDTRIRAASHHQIPDLAISQYRALSTSTALFHSAGKQAEFISQLLDEDEADSDDDLYGQAGTARIPSKQKQSKRAKALQALQQIKDDAISELLEQRAAREVMEDPLSRMMASQGMPLGIAIDAIRQGSSSKAHNNELQSDKDTASSTHHNASQGYQMEALDEIFNSTQESGRSKPASIAAAEPAISSTSSNSTSYTGQEGGSMGSAAGGGSHGDGNDDDSGRKDSSQEHDSLDMEQGSTDSWGTTRQNPAEIARRLVQSNEGQPALDEQSPSDDINPADEPLDDFHTAPGEEKYRTLEQMSSDIKGLDEVFEVLAQVPWLDEDNLQQKELKGVAMVGLLGTLEEVGFHIRSQVERIWAGEHDDGMILECDAAKDQAALISILFHTKKIKDEYGEPSAYIPSAPTRQAVGSNKPQSSVSASILEQLLNQKGKDNTDKA